MSTTYEQETITLEEVASLHATADAVLCLIGSRQVWVPQSVIHEDSEVFDAGQIGKLVIFTWWATREGLGT